jgi:glycosyltransferase involved in cell wall biosynthesis
MRDHAKRIEIIIPVYNEQDNLQWHHDRIQEYFKDRQFKYKLTYVDDGSIDQSLDIIKNICADDPNAGYISFSRNFGKEAATSAGLHNAYGDATLVIDADGQHPIELFDQFVAKWEEGYDVVIGLRTSNTGEGPLKKYGSRLFYALLGFINGRHRSIPGVTDFRLIDRAVVDEYNKLTEHNRVTRNLIDWLGYRRAYVPFEAEARHAGKASYSLRKLFKLALDGLVTNSTRPLKFIGLIGILISSLSVLAATMLAFEKYAVGDPWHLAITGSSILALFLSFLIGIVLVCQGLLALYLENVYHETQNRPLYIVREQG